MPRRWPLQVILVSGPPLVLRSVQVVVPPPCTFTSVLGRVRLKTPMWAVIRARQGIGAEGVGHERPSLATFDAHMKHMTSFANKGSNHGVGSEHSVSLAFERTNFQKMTQLVAIGSREQRRTALAIVDKTSRAPSNLILYLKAGLVPALVAASDDADASIRESVAMILLLVARATSGRRQLLEQKAVPVVEALMCDDGSSATRMAASDALTAFCADSSGECLTAVVEHGLVKLAIERCAEENDAVLPPLLCALGAMLQSAPGTAVAISGGAVHAMTNLLSSETASVRAAALKVLTMLAIPPHGKAACVQEPDLISRELELLLDANVPEVQLHAARCLSEVALSLPAKSILVDLDACEMIKGVLQATSSNALRLDVLKVVTNIAEHPRGRPSFQDLLPVLDAWLASDLETAWNTDSALFQKHVSIARTVIAWKP